MVKTAFETGRLSLDSYIEKTVFHTRVRSLRTISRRSCSSSRAPGRHPGVGAGAGGDGPVPALHAQQRITRAARVPGADIRALLDFQSFLTSCYLGQVKPDEDIYRNALGIAGCDAREGIFIDDRPVNVETALKLDLQAIRFENLDQLRAALAAGIGA